MSIERLLPIKINSTRKSEYKAFTNVVLFLTKPPGEQSLKSRKYPPRKYLSSKNKLVQHRTIHISSQANTLRVAFNTNDTPVSFS